jgi:hypothetical protein
MGGYLISYSDMAEQQQVENYFLVGGLLHGCLSWLLVQHGTWPTDTAMHYGSTVLCGTSLHAAPAGIISTN